MSFRYNCFFPNSFFFLMRIKCNKPCKTLNTVQGIGMYSVDIYWVLQYSPPSNSSSDVTLSSVAWSHKFKQVSFRAF